MRGSSFVNEGVNLAFTGPSAVGKTRLAIAIAGKAIVVRCHSALFTTSFAAVELLAVAEIEGNSRRRTQHS